MATRITFPTGQKADFIAEVTKHREHLERGVRKCNETLKRLGIPVTLSRAVQGRARAILRSRSYRDQGHPPGEGGAGTMHITVTHKPTQHQAYRWAPGEPVPKMIRFTVNGREFTFVHALFSEITGHEHVWMKTTHSVERMGPGDWAVLQPDGTLAVLNPEEFEEQYKEADNG